MTLIDSPNPKISDAAIDMVVTRARHPQLKAEISDLIQKDLDSDDLKLSRRAAMAKKFLDEHDMPTWPSPPLSEASTSSPHISNHESFESAESIIPSFSEPVAGWTAVPRERPQSGDDDVRRRRREAVVLHEGAGEVNEDDIIRPADLQ